MKVAKLSLFKPVGILAFFKDGGAQTTRDNTEKERGIMSVPYCNRIHSPTSARIFAHVWISTAEYPERPKTQVVTAYHWLFGAECLLELLDQIHVKLQISLLTHPIHQHPYSRLLLFINKHNLALELFIGKSQSTFQYWYLFKSLFLEIVKHRINWFL